MAATPIHDTTLKPWAGFSLIEVMTTVALLTLGFMGLAAGFIANARAYSRASDDIVVIHAFRQVSEVIRGTPFGEVASRYRGLNFQIPEIDGSVLVNVFVDETESSPEAALLGLPRDLDGDGAAATTDVTNRYFLLPIVVEVSWKGRDGPEKKALHFLLAEEGN